MEKELEKLGMNKKEIQVYLYLVEYGVSAASEIGRKLIIPKSTVNFLADNLWERGLLKKSMRGKTGYYEADIEMLENQMQRELEEKQNVLRALIPQLQERNKNIFSRSKIFHLDGLESCKNSYSQILVAKERIFYEFGAHKDLEDAFGKDFMRKFIDMRMKKKIYCKAIGTHENTLQDLKKDDKKQLRELEIFSDKYGVIASSIVIYGNMALILNLKGDYKGVCIENPDLAQTMKTIFNICKK